MDDEQISQSHSISLALVVLLCKCFILKRATLLLHWSVLAMNIAEEARMALNHKQTALVGSTMTHFSVKWWAFWRFGLSGSWREDEAFAALWHAYLECPKKQELWLSDWIYGFFRPVLTVIICRHKAICFSQALDSHLGHDVCVCQWSYQTRLDCVCLVTNWTFTHGYIAACESHARLHEWSPKWGNLEGLERSE